MTLGAFGYWSVAFVALVVKLCQKVCNLHHKITTLTTPFRSKEGARENSIVFANALKHTPLILACSLSMQNKRKQWQATFSTVSSEAFSDPSSRHTDAHTRHSRENWTKIVQIQYGKLVYSHNTNRASIQLLVSIFHPSQLRRENGPTGTTLFI